ncbi:MAG: cell division protein ZapA [Rhodospirillaceae bacterium]|jgi:cell division protein ZapA|nr:cell division protein ZapA [Rhodospirillaceae bacterium]
MAQVSITLRGRSYQITCDDGQEAHLIRLGGYLDERATQLLESTGPVSDSMLLVMVSLLVADELSDATGELEVLGKRGNGNARVEAEDAVVDAIDSLASRIAGLAEKLEGP